MLEMTGFSIVLFTVPVGIFEGRMRERGMLLHSFRRLKPWEVEMGDWLRLASLYSGYGCLVGIES